MTQPSLIDTVPCFDGPEEALMAPADERMRADLDKVRNALKGGQEFTLDELALLTGVNRGSVGSRVRDLKKIRFGGYDIQRRYLGGRVWGYRMVLTILLCLLLGSAPQVQGQELGGRDGGVDRHTPKTDVRSGALRRRGGRWDSAVTAGAVNADAGATPARPASKIVPADTLGFVPVVVLWGGQLADATTTYIGLSSGRFEEANGLLPAGSTGIIAVKLGYTAGITVVLQKLAKQHPKLAKGLAYGIGAAGVVPAVLNVRMMRRAK